MTVVLITHHMDECIGADRLIVMSNGYMVADGTPGEVFSNVELMEREGLTVPETVRLMYELNGEGFTAHVSEGDRVKNGQKLISFDKKFIESKGYKTVTPVIVTNSDDYKSVKLKASGSVGYNDVLIELEKE